MLEEFTVHNRLVHPHIGKPICIERVLSRGAIEKILTRSPDAGTPKLQIVHWELHFPADKEEQYRMVLSDGVYCYDGVLSPECNHLCMSEDGHGKVDRTSIIRLDEYEFAMDVHDPDARLPM